MQIKQAYKIAELYYRRLQSQKWRDKRWVRVDDVITEIEETEAILKKDLEIQLKNKRKGASVKLDFALQLLNDLKEDLNTQ